MKLPAREYDELDQQAEREGRAIYSAFRSLVNGEESRRSNRAAASQSDKSLPKHHRTSEQYLREREKTNHAQR